MPPPEEKPMPLPRPKPKPPKPKPRPEPGLEPGPARPRPEPEREVTRGGVPVPWPLDADGCAKNCTAVCAGLRLCAPPPSRPATVHLRSSRLPTPLIALSASLLALSAVLLLALLVHRLVRRRRRRRRRRGQAAPPAQQDEEGGQVLAAVVEEEEEEEGEEVDGDGGVHHVWYIRTKGLDERAIASIAAVVYDAKKRGGGGGGGDVEGDGGCAVCLAEFRDGETLRLLPRCRHAFHRGCIDTWLRAHVNCPLCRAPVQVAAAAAAAANAAAAPGATTTTPRARGEPGTNLGAVGGAQTEQPALAAVPERAVRRAASMVALPTRAWPDVSAGLPASSSGREGEMTGLGKVRRLLKLSEALEMAGVGVGRSVSFGAGSCQRLPATARSGPSAAGVNATDDLPW
ncbi:hypothetical protein ACP4OV_009107 [Aristida adscensionis]